MGLWTRIRVGLLVLMVTVAGARAEKVLKPGETVTPDWEGGQQAPNVYLPAGKAPSSGWPLIIFYPGMDGKPDASTMRRVAGDETFVILAMPYITGGAPNMSEKELAALQKLTDKFRSRIATEVKIDNTRIIFAGFSKGGYYAASFGARETRGIAGICILNAHLLPHDVNSMTRRSAYHTASTYIGMGTLADERFAKSTYDFLKGEGCEVFLDEWVGMRSMIPEDVPYLNAWFGIVGGTWDNTTKDGKARLFAWSKDAFKAADELEGAARYTALRTLTNDPRFPLCTSKVQAYVKESLEATVKASEAAANLHKATLAFKEAEGTKVERRKRESIVAQRAVYASIIEKYPDSPEAIRSKERIEWLDDLLERLKK